MSAKTQAVMNLIVLERLRQDYLKAEGRFKYTAADAELSNSGKLAMLVEEIGEVARAIQELDESVNDGHGLELKKELTQCAAIIVAWLESL